MKNILLIEENNHLSKLYYDALIEEGYAVYVERYPDYDTMTLEKMELVIIDINVFKLATLALLLYVKSINPSLPIVALYEPPFQKYEFLQEYVDSFVMKSGNLSELIDIIQEYFEKIQFQNVS